MSGKPLCLRGFGPILIGIDNLFEPMFDNSFYGRMPLSNFQASYRCGLQFRNALFAKQAREYETMLKSQRKIEFTQVATTHVDIFVEYYEQLKRWALQLSEYDHQRSEDLLHDFFLHFTVSKPISAPSKISKLLVRDHAKPAFVAGSARDANAACLNCRCAGVAP